MCITAQLDLPEALAEKVRAEGLLQPPLAMPSVGKNSPDDSPVGVSLWRT